MADTIVMCTGAREDALDAKLSGYLDSLTLHLYSNNHTPAIGDTTANFTECNFPGYANSALSDFGAVYLNGSNNAETDSGVHTFTCNGTPSGGNQTVYGWFTTFGSDLGPAAAFAAPTPITLTGANQSISIQVLFEDGALL